MKLNIGLFPSIPWIPYYSRSASWPVNLRVCESSDVRGLVEAGELDVTPMATVDWFAMSDQWHRLSNWGIAFRRRAGSVLFFSNKPPAQLDLADVAICGETTTSVRVLEAILKGKYGLRIGRWRRNVDVDDAETPRLLIQNQAVEEAQRGRFAHVMDIGAEWWEWQGTPIVSAVWVHRREMDKALRCQVHKLLKASMESYFLHSAEVISAHKSAHRWNAPIVDVQALHGNFEYALGEECERGIQRMRAVLPVDVEGFANAQASDDEKVITQPARLQVA